MIQRQHRPIITDIAQTAKLRLLILRTGIRIFQLHLERVVDHMPSSNDEVISLCDGQVSVWVESGSSIHLKCITKYGDPVELNAEEARELCDVLRAAVKQIE